MAVLPQPMRVARDVEATSRWYQALLGLQSAHGGPYYDQLVDGTTLVMKVHKDDEADHHGRLGEVGRPLDAHGVLLWFEVDNFDSVEERAHSMGVEVVLPRHRNPPDGNGGPNHWELWLRDPEGAIVVVASPYGTADGNWQP